MSLMHRIRPIEPVKPRHAKPASIDPAPSAIPAVKGKGGRPKSGDPKVAVTLRLPASVLERWQRDPEWRARMADVLAKG